jgi:hypothetical protein
MTLLSTDACCLWLDLSLPGGARTGRTERDLIGAWPRLVTVLSARPVVRAALSVDAKDDRFHDDRCGDRPACG